MQEGKSYQFSCLNGDVVKFVHNPGFGCWDLYIVGDDGINWYEGYVDTEEKAINYLLDKQKDALNSIASRVNPYSQLTIFEDDQIKTNILAKLEEIQ